jgi:hypothetical protein
MGSTASKASSSSQAIDGLGLEIPPSYGLPRPTPESLRKLNQLLKGNHFTYGFLFNDKAFHNHAPHVCCCTWILLFDQLLTAASHFCLLSGRHTQPVDGNF